MPDEPNTLIRCPNCGVRAGKLYGELTTRCRNPACNCDLSFEVTEDSVTATITYKPTAEELKDRKLKKEEGNTSFRNSATFK